MDPRVVDDVIERLLQFGRELMMEEDSAVDEEKQQEKGQEVVKYADLLEAEIIAVCDRARQVFLGQNMLLDLEGDSIHICGDIHGQLWDLIKIFQLGGFPPSVGYLFLGDYVDRGKHGIETITLLLAYKIKNPEYFFLLRGNHECSMISRVYGFYDECKDRYSPKVWRAFMAAFDCMPVAAVVNERIFCVHGGLSPQLKNLQQINQICRPTQIGEEGIVCDLLWSDPENNFKGWGPNDRGVSYIFGKDVVNNFCEKHDMDLVCRGHQVVEDGYHFFCNKKLLTVFSASNYCGEFDNAGAMLTVGHNLRCSLQTWNNKKKTTTSGSTTTATRSSNSNGNGSSSNHK